MDGELKLRRDDVMDILCNHFRQMYPGHALGVQGSFPEGKVLFTVTFGEREKKGAV